MTKSDLEKWRFRAPLLMVSNALIPIVIVFVKDADTETKLVQILILPISWIIAFFYSAMKLRNIVWLPELDRHVGKLIRSTLIDLIPQDLQVTEEERSKLRNGEIWRKLTGVFWEAIDSEPQLVQQKEHFYANGIFYSTAVDLYIILPATSILYSFFSLYKQICLLVPNSLANVFLIYSSVCLVVGLLSRILILPSCRQHHLDLSREQLDLLKRMKHDFISDRFRDIVTEWRVEEASQPADVGDA